MAKAQLILASNSPRRKELLKMLGLSFEVFPAPDDEEVEPGLAPDDLVKILAYRKAGSVSELCPGKVVVGADTVVEIDGRILGKPQSAADARHMLQQLSAHTHRVYTGVCVMKGNRVDLDYDCTSVTFYPLTDDEIAAYIATNEPMDKAGSYGIQGRGALFVKKIEGDFYSVMGLPVAKLYRMLQRFGDFTQK